MPARRVSRPRRRWLAPGTHLVEQLERSAQLVGKLGELCLRAARQSEAEAEQKAVREYLQEPQCKRENQDHNRFHESVSKYHAPARDPDAAQRGAFSCECRERIHLAGKQNARPELDDLPVGMRSIRSPPDGRDPPLANLDEAVANRRRGNGDDPRGLEDHVTGVRCAGGTLGVTSSNHVRQSQPICPLAM